MREITDGHNNRRVTLNVNYVVSVHEAAPWTDINDDSTPAQITTVKTVDGSTHLFKGTYEEVLKELFE